MSLIRIVKHCLSTELKLVQMAENVSSVYETSLKKLSFHVIYVVFQPPVTGGTASTLPVMLDRHQEISRELDILRKRTQV